MMELIVNRNSQYKELLIEEGNSRIESGLLNDEEMFDCVIELLNAAIDIMPPGYDDRAEELQKVLESM